MANSGDDPEPPARRPLLGNIFHLAQATSKGVDHRTARAAIRRCKTCDAARPDDAGLEVCAYCGSRFDGVGADGDGER